ncbi:hypothetical protein ACFLQU_04130 [Verrucomicrobiota bacterium]
MDHSLPLGIGVWVVAVIQGIMVGFFVKNAMGLQKTIEGMKDAMTAQKGLSDTVIDVYDISKIQGLVLATEKRPLSTFAAEKTELEAKIHSGQEAQTKLQLVLEETKAITGAAANEACAIAAGAMQCARDSGNLCERAVARMEAAETSLALWNTFGTAAGLRLPPAICQAIISALPPEMSTTKIIQVLEAARALNLPPIRPT